MEREGLLLGQQLALQNIAQAIVVSFPLLLCLLLFILQPGEDTPASPTGVGETRGTAVTGYKSSLDWRRVRRQGPIQTVGETIMSH